MPNHKSEDYKLSACKKYYFEIIIKLYKID